MALPGVYEPDITKASVLDYFRGLTTADGLLRTRLIHREDAASVLLATTAMSAALSAFGAGLKSLDTWSALAAINGSSAGQPGRVQNSDAGTHTDPVVGGTVANAGEYAWSVTPPGWKRIGNYQDASAHMARVDNPHAVTKAQVGLGNVDNTSDANKPVSTAQAAALTAHTGRSDNPHAVTKAQVGLGNADNTSDASKPISTAAQAALDVLTASDVLINAGLTLAGYSAQAGDPADMAIDAASFVLDRVDQSGQRFGLFGSQEFTDQPGVDVTDLFGFVVYRLDADGNMVIPGSGASVSARVDKSLSAYGLPLQQFYGLSRMRQVRERLRAIERGQNVQLVIAVKGDSWTCRSSYYLEKLVNYLAAKYGDAGPGYTSFGFTGSEINGNARSAVVTIAKSGSGWTCNFGSDVTPDGCLTQSSTAADKFTVAYVPSSPDVTSAIFWYVGAADGVIRYRWNGGGWTTQTLSGSGLLSFDMGAVPAGAWTLEVEVVSGTCKIGGIDLRGSGAGVRVHKIAASGTWTATWITPDATQWQSGITGLGVHALLCMGGTNSQNQYAGTTEKTNMATLVGRVRAAVPLADIMLVTSAENARTTNLRPMSEMAGAHRENAYELRLAHCDLQYAFGSDVNEYKWAGDGSTLDYLDNSLIHPNGAIGGYLIADSIIKAFEQI